MLVYVHIVADPVARTYLALLMGETIGVTEVDNEGPIEIDDEPTHKALMPRTRQSSCDPEEANKLKAIDGYYVKNDREWLPVLVFFSLSTYYC